MFKRATSFTGDISRWDVRSVRTMEGMFQGARSFNIDMAKWDVSSVTNMDNMFFDARSFGQKLCTANWVHSQATREDMFVRSPGEISRTVCHNVNMPSVTDLSSKGDYCSNSQYGPIGDWDITSVKDMSSLFAGSHSFNATSRSG